VIFIVSSIGMFTYRSLMSNVINLLDSVICSLINSCANCVEFYVTYLVVGVDQ
jgi:hypothetical protein